MPRKSGCRGGRDPEREGSLTAPTRKPASERATILRLPGCSHSLDGMSRRVSSQLLRMAIGAAGPLTLAQGALADGSLIAPAGAIADAQLTHLLEVTALTMIAVLPVLVLVPLILWRYRYGNARARYAPGWGESRGLDLVMWGVPFAIIAVAGFLLWRSTHALDPYRPIEAALPPTRVQVVGLDWKWLFIYPDAGIATVSEMAFPADRPVALDLTSDTVMQSFMIGALGGQIYAMAGMRTQLHLAADGPGEFRGENMQYSGEGFHTQKFRALALDEADYRAWIEAARAVAVPLDAASYARLAERGTKDDLRRQFPGAVTASGAIAFRLTGPDLFQTVLDRYRAPRPVPPAAQPGAPAYRATPAGAQ